jgi:Type II CAAX prenyl endopeptidase Rce1-like
MKADTFAYLSLIAYPACTMLVPEPNMFRWWLRTGGRGPVPDEVKRKAIRNAGDLMIAKFLLLVLCCSALVLGGSVSASSLGFRSDQPRGAFAAAAAAGGLLIWWDAKMRALARRAPRGGEQPFVLREGTRKILLIMVVGGFAEEFWRALSLTAFGMAGFGAGSAVLLTSAVFGVGHLLSPPRSLGAALGRSLRPAMGGALLALLFLLGRSLLPPLIVHVLTNSVAGIMGRRRWTAEQASAGGG